MNPEQRRHIKRYLDILLRRKNLILICILLGILAGLGLYLTKPKIYRCQALLKYQRQSVNPTAMSPDDIKTRARDAVETVSQQIMSRSSLEEIITTFDLYPSMRREMPMEDIVDMMREHHIRTRFLEGGDVFEVSYQGGNQDKVLKVTNALAAKFIEENLRYRQERASQTSSYVKDELRMAKEALDKEEQAMRDYKLKYYNEMPDQLSNNMSRLNALQTQYQHNQESIQEMERTRLLVQEQISLRKEFLAKLAAESAPPPPGASSAGNELSDIDQVRLKLRNLRTRYTEKHPEIRRLKKILAELEAKQNSSGTGSDPTGFDPQIDELRQQLNDIEYNISRLKKERDSLREQIARYEKWIAAAPVREAEWSALTRDYKQLNLHYQNLVTQSLQAESAQTLENQQRGSQFKIIDSAHFPEKPFKPDFKKIMLVSLFLGLLVGICGALAIESTTTSFRDPVDLEKYLGMEVVCAIPILLTKKERFRKNILRTIWNILLVLAYLGTISAGVYFWKQGVIIL